MKNALISPDEMVSYISEWLPIGGDPRKGYYPVNTIIKNAERVAEVLNTPFEVAPPLFWVQCADNVLPDQFYYDSVSKQLFPTPPNAPYPEPVEPTVSGAQTL